MSSNALKLMALVTLVLALGLGFVAYKMSQRLTAAPSQPEVQETREQKELAYTMAAVLIKPVLAHQAIEKDDVELVPVSVLPPNYFTSKDEVIGKTPLVDLDVGTTLTERVFKQSNVLSKSIPEGHRAMSLQIDDVIAVGGFVQPGDVVDALLYIQSKGKEVDDSQARLLLGEAMVLAYEERLLPETEGDKDEEKEQGQRQRRQRTVVLAVPEKDTVKVMLGASIGEIRLALHGQIDEENAADAMDATQVVSTDGGESKDKEENEEDAVKPITLRELGEIKKKRSKAGYVPPPIVVYRGSDVETVRR